MLNDLKLVFVHIPKTGGTSLIKYLETLFGQNLVVQINRSKISSYDEAEILKKTNKDIQVLAGHFFCDEFNPKIVASQDIKFITWLRNPIKRVISHYTHGLKQVNSLNPLENKTKRRFLTLSDYAMKKSNQNLMSKYVNSFGIDRFDFIGCMEHYERDLRRLGEVLGKSFEYDRLEIHNKRGIKIEPSEKELDLIRHLNRHDIELYQDLCS